MNVEEFRALIDKNRVKCELCSYEGHSLIKHLKLHHDMTAGQYKKQFPNSYLASPVLSELIKRLDKKQAKTDDLTAHIKLYDLTDKTEEIFKKVAGTVLTPANLVEFIPTIDPNYEFEDDAKIIVLSVLQRKYLYIEGPTGAGKTEGVFQVHARVKRPLRKVNMTGEITVANFIGQERASPSKGTYFQEGILPWCMENGVTLLIDEIDATPPAIAFVLYPIMEKRGSVYIPAAGRSYAPTEGFTIIATANTGGKGDTTGVYSGTEVLNTAFLDRFPLKLKKDYLPPDRELDMLLKRFPGQAPAPVTNMIKLANEIRTAFKQGNLSITASTRKLIEYYELLPQLGHVNCINLTILNWLDDDDRTLVTNIMDRLRIGYKEV